jgi:hypothetical protein
MRCELTSTTIAKQFSYSTGVRMLVYDGQKTFSMLHLLGTTYVSPKCFCLQHYHLALDKQSDLCLGYSKQITCGEALSISITQSKTACNAFNVCI